MAVKELQTLKYELLKEVKCVLRLIKQYIWIVATTVNCLNNRIITLNDVKLIT